MRGLGGRENETGTGFMWSFIGFRVSDNSGSFLEVKKNRIIPFWCLSRAQSLYCSGFRV